MKKNYRHWTMPVGGLLLLAATGHAGATPGIYLDSTNRVTLSLRFGLNISGKFKGVGSSFTSGSPLGALRRTPNGDPYNYDNGYVYPDSSGSLDNLTYYWGYVGAKQVNVAGSTISFDRTTATGLPLENSADDSPNVGAEIAYDFEMGKDDGRHLSYGFEAACNFMPVEFNSGGGYTVGLSKITDTYGYEPGTRPPAPGYTGGRGPGAPGGQDFILDYNHTTSPATPAGSASFAAQQHFDANLWGGRLGPYLEYAFAEKWSLHLSGGLAVGLIDAQASWNETLTLPGGAGTLTASGGGNDTDLLWGFYVGLEASYQIKKDWSLDTGVQFQDLGTYSHNFGGRTAELDLSQSIFVHAGLSYSF